MAIVVLGATGRLGHVVVERLLARGVAAHAIHGAGRRPDRLAALALQGIAVSSVEYDDAAAVSGVLREGDSLLLISGSDMSQRAAQHQRIVDAARRAGVARVVYTSVLNAHEPALVVAEDHLFTEKVIRESGLPFTFLRNAWYTENFTPLLRFARSSGEIITSTGDGRVASAARADLAEAAAAILSEGGAHDGRTYELGGEDAWSFDEFAKACAVVTGRAVTHRGVTSDHHIAILRKAGVAEAAARFIAALDDNIRHGVLAASSGDLARLIGRPPTPLIDTLRAVNAKLARRTAATDSPAG